MEMGKSNGKLAFEIVKKIGVVSEKEGCWKRELNLVSWNGGEPKYDIRDWSPDHKRMYKGLTLTEMEARSLMKVLKEEFEGDV